MRARRGDHIILAAEQLGHPTRDGEILEVRGRDGAPPYVVRWSDGHEGTIFPGPGTILRSGEETVGAEEAAPGATEERLVDEWQIRVSVYESGDDTTARVALVSGPVEHTDATGEAHRSPRDRRVPKIGNEVAVARALRHLADQLLDKARHEVEEVTGEHDVDIRAN